MRWTVWFVAALVVLVVPGDGAAAPPKGGTITVQTMTAKLMKTPSYLGATAAKLVRGDQLRFEEARGDWYRGVTPKGVAGWIHRSGVIEKAVALSSKPGGGSGGVTSDEVALAGRGFSKEVVAKYKQTHPSLDYSHVDRIEKLEIDPEAVARFAAEGKLGGAK